MFTGVVQEIGTLASRNGPAYFFEASRELVEELRVGGSISINGACLTAVEVDERGGTFGVEVSPETLSKTALQNLKIRDEVNLELPLGVGGFDDKLNGHILQGHVDTVGKVVGISRRRNSYLYRYSVSTEFSHNLVEKGSIGIEGISLTTYQVKGGSFATTLTPYTYENTVLKDRRKGSEVNVEFDILGKYILNRKNPFS